MKNISMKAKTDKHGVSHVGGLRFQQEQEIDVFRRLAKKYLLRDLVEVLLLTDPPQIKFDVKN